MEARFDPLPRGAPVEERVWVAVSNKRLLPAQPRAARASGRQSRKPFSRRASRWHRHTTTVAKGRGLGGSPTRQRNPGRHEPAPGREPARKSLLAQGVRDHRTAQGSALGIAEGAALGAPEALPVGAATFGGKAPAGRGSDFF